MVNGLQLRVSASFYMKPAAQKSGRVRTTSELCSLYVVAVVAVVSWLLLWLWVTVMWLLPTDYILHMYYIGH